jgi:hypothetical protein
MISIFLHLLKLALWLNILSTLEKVLCTWEEGLFCCYWTDSSVHVCRSIWSKCSLKPMIPYLFLPGGPIYSQKWDIEVPFYY